MSLFFDLPETLSVFPLPEALLLPRARLPLQIFEPRYLAMLDDALRTEDRLIGMIQPNVVPGRDGPGLYQIGCAGRVTSFSEMEGRRYMITLTGVSRFRVLQEVDGFTPYRRCTVSWDGFDRDLADCDKDPIFNRPKFMRLMERYFDLKGLSVDWPTLEEAEDELLINSLSMLLEFGSEDKQALLEAPSLTTRRETLVTLVEYALRGGGAGTGVPMQ